MSSQITRKFGATAPQVVTFKSASTGKAISVAGWTDIKMYIDRKRTPEDDSSRVTVLDGVIGTNTGDVSFPLATPIPVGGYYYQVKFTDANGYVDITDTEVFKVEDVLAK